MISRHSLKITQMLEKSNRQPADISCRTICYIIEQLNQIGLEIDNLVKGLPYSLEELQQPTLSISWDEYLQVFENSYRMLTPEQIVFICSSYRFSAWIRPLMLTLGIWYDPAKYYEKVVDPKFGGVQQLFPCIQAEFKKINKREVAIEMQLLPGYTPPPKTFWEVLSIGLSSLTLFFGLEPSVVTWEPLQRGALFRIRLPKRRPLRTLLLILSSRLRRQTLNEFRVDLINTLQLERQMAARQRAERCLKQAEERLRQITNSIPGIVYQYFLDPDGKQGFAFVSGGISDLTGLTSEELIQNPDLIWELIPPEYIDKLRASVVVSAQTGTPWYQEFPFRTKEGQVRWIRGQSIPEPPDATGRILWNGIMIDITEQKQAEERIREQTAKLQAITTTSLAQIHELDRNSVIHFSNSGFVGQAIVERLASADRERFLTTLHQVFEQGVPYTGEFLLTDDVGKIHSYAVSLAPIHTSQSIERVVFTGIDVTERVRATEMLASRERELQTIANHVPVILSRFDKQYRHLYVNAAVEPITGLPPEAFLGKSNHELGMPSDLSDFIKEILTKVFETGESQTGEFSYLAQNGLRNFEVTFVPEFGPDQTVISVFGVTHDITERRIAEEKLRESETRFRHMAENIPGAIIQYTLHSDGTDQVNYMNTACEEIWEVPAEAVHADSQIHWRMVHPEDVEGLKNFIADSAKKMGPVSHSWRIITPSGRLKWLQVYARPELLPANAIRWNCAIFDVTFQKQAEEKLRASEEKFRALFEASPYANAVTNSQGQYVAVNTAFTQMTGLTAEQVIGKTRAELGLIPQESQGQFNDIMTQLATHGQVYNGESSLPSPTGQRSFLYSIRRVLIDNEIQDISTAIDITKQKQAEAALRESEERFRTLIHDLDVGVILLSPQGQITLSNPAASEILGLSAEELQGILATDLRWQIVREDETPFSLDEIPFSIVVQTGQPFRNIVVGATNQKTGTRTWMQVNGTPRSAPDGSLLHVILTFIDITSRKKVEDELRLKDSAIATSINAKTFLDLDGRVSYVNRAFVDLWGYQQQEEVLGRHATEFWQNPSEVEDIIEQLRKVGSYQGELTGLRKDGTFFNAQISANLIRDRYGRPTHMMGSIVDITAQKQAAEEVVRARDAAEMALNRLKIESARAEQFARLAEVAGQGICISRLDGHFTYLNPFFRRLLEIPPEDEISAHTFWEFLPSELHLFMHDAVLPITQKVGNWIGEMDLLTKTGKRLSVLNNISLVHNTEGELTGYANIITDITGRKQAELKLREIEKRQRLALDAGQMGTWEWEIGTDRLNWDARQIALFGFPPHGFDGRLSTFLKFIHSDDLAAVQQVLNDAAKGKDFNGQFRIIRSDGTIRWLHGAGIVSFDSIGLPKRLIGINYDVTDRVLSEQMLRESIREKEAMLQEIHHRVKNNLQVITSLLNLQAERIKEPSARSVFLESQNRVRAMALVHETLYGSESLARVELPRYLGRLCDSLLQTFGGNDRVYLERDIDPIELDLDRALPIGLITSELVSNALKYAFPSDQKGLIRVVLKDGGNSDYLLIVSDNGVGLPKDFDPESLSSLGLYLVRVLTRQIRATLEIGRDQVGTTFTLRLPK